MDAVDYLRFIASLVLVLALMLGLLWGLKALNNRMQSGRFRGQRRMKLVESLSLDNRRRLVLVEQDGREHLLLIGGSSDVVVEKDLKKQCPPTDP